MAIGAFSLLDLVQMAQISEHAGEIKTLEDRVSFLEQELFVTREILSRLMIRIEEHLREDIDGDGIVGVGASSMS